jgi:hypothetical protein
VALRPGEQLLTDGRNEIRARCGNRISDTPQEPTAPKEPEVTEFDRAVPPIPEIVSSQLTMALPNGLAVSSEGLPLDRLNLPPGTRKVDAPFGEEPGTGSVKPTPAPLGASPTTSTETIVQSPPDEDGPPNPPDTPGPPPTPIPEPDAMLLAVTGVAAAAAHAWRRRRR